MMLVRRSGLTNMLDMRNIYEILKCWGYEKYAKEIKRMTYSDYTELLNEMVKYEQQYVKENENNG